MAEEEKVLVDEISNKALNQLKKTFEPTAEEKFEAKRIKAALAGAGGGGTGVAGAAAGMFGSKGKGAAAGGFLSKLKGWMALPVIMLAGTIMKMGKGAWNMLTKFVKIIFWPIRWLLGMTGKTEIKAAGDVAKKAKGGGLLKAFGWILKPFVWIMGAWAFLEGWMTAKDRNNDGVISTYEKFLGGLEEILKWFTFGFVDFKTFDRVSEWWGNFSFKDWVDKLVIKFDKFPEELGKWMDDKTRGLGTFVKGFGKILTDFLFGKDQVSATNVRGRSGGVMGWIAENLSADKVSSAIIGISKLAIAFGGMLLTIAQYALIGTKGEWLKSETWSKKSLFGFVKHEVEPRLPEIGKTIVNTIMGLFEWVNDITTNLTDYIIDQFISAGEKEDAGMVTKWLGGKMKDVKEAKIVYNKNIEDAKKDREKYEEWAKRNKLITGLDVLKITPNVTWEDNLGNSLLDLGKALKEKGSYFKSRFNASTFLAAPKSTSPPSNVSPNTPIGGQFKQEEASLGHKLMTSLFGGKALDIVPGLAGWGDKGKFGADMWNKIGHRGMEGRGWNKTGMLMQQYAIILDNIIKGGITLTSGYRDKRQQRAGMMKLDSLKVYRQEMEDFLSERESARNLPAGTFLESKPNSKERDIAITELLQEFTGTDFFQHMHGNAIDFAYPRGYKAKDFPALQSMIEGALPGTRLLSHDGHLHLQRNINAGEVSLNQGRLINDMWKNVYNTLYGSGGGGGNQTTIISNVDQSSSESGSMIVAAGATDQNTPGIRGSGSENLVNE